jgi:hypothetical protein
LPATAGHDVTHVRADEGYDCSLTEGKLLFQSEGAELYFRRLDLEPLK